MRLRVKDVKDEDAKEYIINDFFTDIKVTAHKRSCFFCEYCPDIIYDYTNGPYMFFCTKGIDWDEADAMHGNCAGFIEDEEDEGDEVAE